MDHPWHFPAAGDLCPGCSARHFPFCPPPPLPPHPFPYDLEPPPPPPPQYPAPFHPTPPPPSPPPYQAPFHPPQQMWGPPDPGPHPYELPGREGPPKRMRVGEASPFDRYDAAPPPPPSLLGRPSVEGERLLSLVRDHGHPRLPASPPPSQWHGQRYRPDGFSYGGGAGYHSPYGRGADFANFDHAGRLPPPGPMHDSYNALDTGFLPVRGPHESYFNGDHRYHQFHPEAFPSAQPLPPLPPYADSGKPYDSRGWHPEAGAVPPPPEHPFPSHSDYHAMPPRPTANSSLFPVLSGSLATIALPPSAQTFHQAHPMADTNCYDGQSNNKGPGSIYRPQSEKNLVDGGAISVHHSLDHSKVTIINACDLFKQPLRASRPDHIVIILRGLPGSGKSYIAKALRDLEVENGASAPRIHSMDDYFMIEVEKKIEDNEGSKSSSSSKGRRQLTKKVIEYCYEPEMEETYRSSMLNAFKKTLDEGNFTFVIVDDRNLRVADFAQLWAIAKKSGYEVYLLEAPYKDPTGCAARNVHGFTLDDIKKMAADWEEAPPLYLRLDIHSLFHDDNLHGHSIQEVDMDTEDVDDTNDAATNTSVEDSKKTIQEPLHEDEGLLKPGEKWNDEEDLNGFKELGQSKWSKYFEEDTEKSENAEKNKHALSGLAQTYGTHRKSVSWGDRLEKGGFSIAATKRKPSSSLIIGPGSGYNLVSNPLVEDFTGTKGRTNNETKKRFNEQLRDEGESFRAVFDKRKQRIGVFEAADDD